MTTKRLRVGLSTLLKSVDIEVCAQTTNGEEAVEKSIQLRPDLIILDIQCRVSEEWKQRGRSEFFLQDVPILFFTMHNTPQLFEIAKSVGAQGFVTKEPNGRKADRSSRCIAQQEDLLHLVIVPSCIGAILPNIRGVATCTITGPTASSKCPRFRLSRLVARSERWFPGLLWQSQRVFSITSTTFDWSCPLLWSTFKRTLLPREGCECESTATMR